MRDKCILTRAEDAKNPFLKHHSGIGRFFHAVIYLCRAVGRARFKFVLLSGKADSGGDPRSSEEAA